ncbi:YhbY family RNA-binding protein [Companilactobacillus sp.]|jgi:RNA-binding protein|uniref:YhbY family RNA-binding protein n=1 Tax=Companilactobacillus sp. TaxID=2767905 RepID=UPI0025C24647|nr:YhbY family RNA-binding protein [Companilactobacillus sp.]MCH4007987.1 YhbY family RNA-binding protein [Companilactobacillus sp.]MCH4051834.1 YhbY family RNA-binding protein [Companilactobacillus sp.]MCH4075930.1 YhbY family RNA-binding protein [Companilactobacillus sp.]MCH4124505.1 YhbY family RNA-binding protein [Companilactobacillus sp.]MCH4132532.1 YhbY family RNA-binding protein [Companilactobacillus sp.]
MIIKGKQNRYLRSQAQTMKPVVQVGRDGISDNLLKQILQLLNKDELIKVTLLQNTMVGSEQLVAALNEIDGGVAHVQTIGSKVILYKKSSKIKNRKYSLELEKI